VKRKTKIDLLGAIIRPELKSWIDRVIVPSLVKEFVPKAKAMMMAQNELKTGCIVDVQLNSGERLLGEVKAIHETVSGRKVQVAFSCERTALVSADQILRVVRRVNGGDAGEIHGGDEMGIRNFSKFVKR
jgi:hypothetical protein